MMMQDADLLRRVAELEEILLGYVTRFGMTDQCRSALAQPPISAAAGNSRHASSENLRGSTLAYDGPLPADS